MSRDRLRPLADDRVDDIAWALGEGGHSFWTYVDSTPTFVPRQGYGHTEDCYTGYGNEDCSLWAHRRADKQCLAANSQGDRCSQWASRTAPFCDFHLKRAWEVFYASAVETERDLLRRDIEVLRRDSAEERRRLRLHLGLEAALEADAAMASALLERVYFYAVDHAVKIGRSKHPEKRVKTLSGTKAPEGLDFRAGRLLGTIPGGCHVESRLHDRFHVHRLVGEWFELAPIAAEIHELIAEHAEQVAS